MSLIVVSNDSSAGVPNVPDANTVSRFRNALWKRVRPQLEKDVDAVADTVVTIYSHGFVTTTPIRFTSTGSIPSGVTANTTYYVRSTGTDTFTIHTSEANAQSGASPVDLEDDGSGVVTVTTYYTPFAKVYIWDETMADEDEDETYLKWRQLQSYIEGATTVEAGSAKATVELVAGVWVIDVNEAELDINNMNGGTLPFTVQDGKLFVDKLYVKSPDDNEYYLYQPRVIGGDGVEPETVGPGITPS